MKDRPNVLWPANDLSVTLGGMSPILLLRNAASFLVARMDLRGERGASAVEYGIMVMLIAAVIVVAVAMLGTQTSTSFSCTAETVRTKVQVAGCG
jgi:pilus assembly protein Flp/PilA